MGREVRRVPKDWQHPTENGRLKPLHEGYAETLAGFLAMQSKDGLQKALDYYGTAPDINDYMPEWTEAEKTHIQMYETCSEGTPISPVFEFPEQLAHWLASTHASAFGGMTATYEQWLEVARGGWAPSAVVENGELKSGVAIAKGSVK